MRMKSLGPLVVVLALLLVMASACGGALAPTTPGSEAPSDGAAPSAQEKGGSGNSPMVAQGTTGGTRMVVYTSDITVLVKDTQATVDAVTKLARDLKGYVVNSKLSWQGEDRVATMVIRVVATEHDNAMAQLRALAVKTLDESTSTQDVGEEYADLDAQVRNWQATEAQYVTLLERADAIEEVLQIQEKVSQARGEIDRITGKMNYLKNQTDLATITVTIRPETGTREVGAVGPWDPMGVASDSWNASLGFLQGLASALVALVFFLWWLIPVLVLLIWAWRRWRRGRAQRKPKAARQVATQTSSPPPAQPPAVTGKADSSDSVPPGK